MNNKMPKKPMSNFKKGVIGTIGLLVVSFVLFIALCLAAYDDETMGVVEEPEKKVEKKEETKKEAKKKTAKKETKKDTKKKETEKKEEPKKEVKKEAKAEEPAPAPVDISAFNPALGLFGPPDGKYLDENVINLFILKDNAGEKYISAIRFTGDGIKNYEYLSSPCRIADCIQTDGSVVVIIGDDVNDPDSFGLRIKMGSNGMWIEEMRRGSGTKYEYLINNLNYDGFNFVPETSLIAENYSIEAMMNKTYDVIQWNTDWNTVANNILNSEKDRAYNDYMREYKKRLEQEGITY